MGISSVPLNRRENRHSLAKFDRKEIAHLGASKKSCEFCGEAYKSPLQPQRIARSWCPQICTFTTKPTTGNTFLEVYNLYLGCRHTSPNEKSPLRLANITSRGAQRAFLLRLKTSCDAIISVSFCFSKAFLAENERITRWMLPADMCTSQEFAWIFLQFSWTPCAFRDTGLCICA